MSSFKYKKYDYSAIVPTHINFEKFDLSKDYMIKSSELIDGILHITFYAPIKEIIVKLDVKDLIE